MTKIAQIIEAGRRIEQKKTGFTVPELMSTLSWNNDQKQYVQNTMFQLTQKGKAYKLNNSRPVIYSFKPHGGASIQKAQAPKTASAAPGLGKTTEAAGKPTAGPLADTPVERRRPAAPEKPVLSLDDLANMEITLEMIGEGVFRRNRELERKIYELESELVETRRKLDDANKRIGEQTRMIEKQNQVISGQNRDRGPTAKVRDLASVPSWKRRT